MAACPAGAAIADDGAGRRPLILDGLRGPQVGPMNLAGVLPWIHWRGLLILSLLAAGNFFCMACPFIVPRTLARRWLPARPQLAALAAEQVAGRGAAGAVPVGLRGVQPVGQPVVDGLDRDRLLRRWPLSSTASSAAPRSANTSARSASSISCSRWCRRWK